MELMTMGLFTQSVNGLVQWVAERKMAQQQSESRESDMLSVEFRM